MAPWMHGVVGNPSGSHRAARVARRAVEDARDQIAALTGAKPGNVVFTAGGTESCTLAVAGLARAYARRHDAAVIVHSAIEHHAVSDAAAMVAAEDSRVRVRSLGVDEDGVVDLSDVSEALAEALRLVDEERAAGAAHARALRDRLEAGLLAIADCRVTAQSAARLPGTVHVTFPDVASDELLFLLDQAGVYASAAASCSSGAAVASHVLAAMGMPAERAKGSLRLSFGTETSAEDVDAVIAAVTAAVERLRAESR